MAEAKYRLIADELGESITTGRLTPNSRLPTEEQLSKQFGASRNTIRDAVKWLINRGLVETRPGQGTFVVDPPVPFVTTLSGDWQEESGLGGGEGLAALKEVEARDRKARVSVPDVGVKKAEGYIADRLQVAVGSAVVSRHQERYIDEQPWSMQTSYYPMDLVIRGANRLLDTDDLKDGTIKYLRETLQIDQVGFRDLIAVRAPDANETTFFKLPGDGRVSVYVILRTGFTQGSDGPEPFRLTESVFPCDRNQFVVNSGEVPSRGGSSAEIF
ncbi:MAG TPA: GntR family transcriptional regulator [Streptosporangiaceae bacterium]